jgi:hypothetical protein
MFLLMSFQILVILWVILKKYEQRLLPHMALSALETHASQSPRYKRGL